MIANTFSTETLISIPQPAFDQPLQDPDAAAWADLLDNFLGPDHDVYARLLERTGQAGRA